MSTLTNSAPTALEAASTGAHARYRLISNLTYGSVMSHPGGDLHGIGILQAVVTYAQARDAGAGEGYHTAVAAIANETGVTPAEVDSALAWKVVAHGNEVCEHLYAVDEYIASTK